jgi:hypothetical protein
LLAGLLPRLVEGRPLSAPIAFLGLGVLLFALPTGLPRVDPVAHPGVAVHLAEVGVIVALMGAGLKLDRRVGWRRWGSIWRLLAVAMPVSIAAVAVLGWWWMGLAPAAALLLGSALAPTDPVLASDVQVGEPTEDEADPGLTRGPVGRWIGRMCSGWLGHWKGSGDLYGGQRAAVHGGPGGGDGGCGVGGSVR